MILSLLRVCVPLCCFLSDLVLWGTYQAPILLFSRSYFFSVLCAGASMDKICFAGLGVLLVSFIYHGTFGNDLIRMVPLALMVYYIRQIFDLTFVKQVVLVLFCLLMAGTPLWIISQHFILAVGMLYLLRGSRGNRS